MERTNWLSTQNGVAQNEDMPRSSGQPQRQKSVKWTEEEHQLFLMGLNKYGKGDWKNISRYYVITKTPTQVASHAQKFYRRQVNTTPPNKRRPSIHDIQAVNTMPTPKNYASTSVLHRTTNITGFVPTNNILQNTPAIPNFTTSAAHTPILNMNYHGANSIMDSNATFRSFPPSTYQNASLARPSAASYYGNTQPWG